MWDTVASALLFVGSCVSNRFALSGKRCAVRGDLSAVPGKYQQRALYVSVPGPAISRSRRVTSCGKACFPVRDRLDYLCRDIYANLRTPYEFDQIHAYNGIAGLNRLWHVVQTSRGRIENG